MARGQAAMLNSLFWTTFTIARLCTVPLSACLTPGQLLIPTLALKLLSGALVLAYAGNGAVLWLGTVCAGVGVCALYSNVLSLLAAYELLTPRSVSLIGMAAALGHMTIPNLVSLAIHTGGCGHDALLLVCLAADTLGFVTLVAVVLHLQRSFVPAADSLLGQRLREAAAREPSARAHHALGRMDSLESARPL
jgi:hypothetical protein